MKDLEITKKQLAQSRGLTKSHEDKKEKLSDQIEQMESNILQLEKKLQRT